MVTAAVLALALSRLARGLTPTAALQETAQLAIFPVLAIVAFFFHSWFTTGAWFITSGFYLPDNVAHGNPYKAFTAVVSGMRLLIGTPLVLVALAGAALVLVRGFSRAEHAASLVTLALVALMVLPAYAFFQGIRSGCAHMVAPTVGAAVFVGMAIGLLRGVARQAAAIAVIAWLAFTTKPLDAQAPMVQEAQWDVPFSQGRRNVDRVPHARIPRRAHPRQHGLARSLHAGAVRRGHRHQELRARGQSALLAGGDRSAKRPRPGGSSSRSGLRGATCSPRKCANRPPLQTGFTRVCADGGVALYKSKN